MNFIAALAHRVRQPLQPLHFSEGFVWQLVIVLLTLELFFIQLFFNFLNWRPRLACLGSVSATFSLLLDDYFFTLLEFFVFEPIP